MSSNTSVDNGFNPPHPLNTAVLFLVFNRPDVTAQVFAAIKQARPPRLYLAADGPRQNRPGEAEKCAEVRTIVSGVDWPCEVKTLFREENLGCKRAVSSAIDWFFEQEEEGIILEDDCLPAQSFFWFCGELLEKYRHETQVAMVAGTNMVSGEMEYEDCSYLFSRLVQIWGWATWRRVWQLYDVEISGLNNFIECDGFGNLGLNKRIVDYVLPNYHAVAAGQIDTWDIQWSYAVLSRGLLVAVPNVNLVINIGFSAAATHTFNSQDQRSCKVFGNISMPTIHPNSLVPNLSYDLKKIPPRFNFAQRVIRKLLNASNK